MRPPSPAGLVHVGLDLLGTTISDKTNRVTAQLGNAIKQGTESSGAEWVQHVGLCSRPGNPVAGKASAQCVALKTSDRDVVVGSYDLRGMELYGNLKAGETCIYAVGEDCTAQGKILLKSNGAITIYTTDDNTADGVAVYFTVAPDGLSFTAPWGSLKFDATGFHVKHASGAEFRMGGIGGMPAPLDQIASYIRLVAGSVSSEASVLAQGVGIGVELAAADPVLTAIASLQTQMQAVMTALGATATAAGTGTAAATAAAAVSTGSATVAAAALVTKTTAHATQ